MISINWPTGVISVPQSYLTLVSGNLYELDTNQFRLDLKSLEDSPEGMPFTKTHTHNTEVAVAGTTFARIIEILPPYSVEFEDGMYAVRLVGSNNNISDAENGILVVNSVSVISTNSAGLIVGGGGSSAADIWDYLIEGSYSAKEVLRILSAIAAGKTTIVDLGSGQATVTFRDINDTKNRVVADMMDSERDVVTLDPT